MKFCLPQWLKSFGNISIDLTFPLFNIYQSSNAVDNVWYGSWYQSEWAVKSWWLVDLGQNYVISEMKINFSNKKNTDNMHVRGLIILNREYNY